MLTEKKINPLVISKITYTRGRRIGNHPFYKRIINKKFGIFAFLFAGEQKWFWRWKPPSVAIFGANGACLYRKYYKSNEQALEARNQLRKQWEPELNEYKRQQ